MNETGRRKTNERRCDPQAEGIQTQERRKVQRRRQIDPTTCEREYTQDEVEFMQALDEYKRRSGRMFPTCSEILEVLKALGYSKAEAEYAISELDLCPAEGGR
ncbi:MAG TPA: RuvA C-terminal domain-containing protein [Pirellulaceae bacterium]|nr:RuvA C-terminal domain-containing protein [Pirellulaceae bacterium]HMO93240.1 RuvA C-terminal domain-containing protein [Pirellulaceae bacterium]HMP69105.1 RuvA C-terminal domain-containing protein [Pirellulaceae bacterium]